LKAKLHAWRTALGAKDATINPQHDPKKENLLDPAAEHQRQGYLPPP
jgi:hypothetical protein